MSAAGHRTGNQDQDHGRDDDARDIGEGGGSSRTAGNPFTTGRVSGEIDDAAEEKYDPADEHRYWSDAHRSRPYVDSQYSFDDDYGPAYRYGGESWLERADRRAQFEEVEHELGAHWDRFKDKSRLTWEHAREAVRDAWERTAERFGRADLRADDDGMAPDPRRAEKKAPQGSDDPNADSRRSV